MFDGFIAAPYSDSNYVNSSAYSFDSGEIFSSLNYSQIIENDDGRYDRLIDIENNPFINIYNGDLAAHKFKNFFPDIPDSLNSEKLIGILREATWMSNIEYAMAVKTGGKWDFKSIYGKHFENFGNFMYGITVSLRGNAYSTVSRAPGIDKYRSGHREIHLILAGLYQIYSRTNKSEWGVFQWPYGDDPLDQAWIIRGFEYYDMLFLEAENQTFLK